MCSNFMKKRGLQFSIVIIFILVYPHFSNAKSIRSFKTEKDQTVITIQDITDISNKTPISIEINRQLLINIKKNNGDLKQLTYKGPLAKLNKIEFVQAEKALLLGELPYGGNSLIILDIDAGKVLDTIRAYNFSISPSRKLIAYTTWYPRNSLRKIRKSIILLYDLTKTPAENRLPLIRTFSYKNAGFPIFPEKNVYFIGADTNELEQEEIFEKKYNVDIDEEYIMTSPFLWSEDDEKLLFLSFNNDKKANQLVYINLFNGNDNPMIFFKPINLDEFIKWDTLLDETRNELLMNPYKFTVSNLNWISKDKIIVEPYPQYWLDKIITISITDRRLQE